MKFLIIGAGWYGCHLGCHLLSKGHEIVIVDKQNKIFGGSSSKNQNRLHLGHHYPRSPETIKECSDGFLQFIEHYSSFTHEIPNNYYFVASEGSKTTIDTYLTLFPELVTQSLETTTPPLNIYRVNSTFLKSNERFISFTMAASYFTSRLTNYFVEINNPNVFGSIQTIRDYIGDTFDYILNCTYNHLEPFEFNHYEMFLTLLYRIDGLDTFAYTVMDGEYFSVYPYSIEENVYSVTHVKYGVIRSSDDIPTHKENIEKDVMTFIPDWKTRAHYVGNYVSYKTKPVTQTDDRSLRYKIDGSTLHFYGGKITGIFHAEHIVDTTVEIA